MRFTEILLESFDVRHEVELGGRAGMDVGGRQREGGEGDGGTEYDMSDSDKSTIGTEVTLYLNEDSYEFANEYKAKEVIDKYCSFMPVPIYFTT